MTRLVDMRLGGLASGWSRFTVLAGLTMAGQAETNGVCCKTGICFDPKSLILSEETPDMATHPGITAIRASSYDPKLKSCMCKLVHHI